MLAYISFAAYSFMPSFINSLELNFYDFRSKLISLPQQTLPSVIEIPADNENSSKLSFSETEKLMSLLSVSENAPALAVFTSQIQIPNPDANEIAVIKDKYEELKKNNKIKDKNDDLLKLLTKIQNEENPGQKLYSSLEKINSMLPVSFETGIPTGKLKEVPAWMKKFSIKAMNGAALASARSEASSYNAQEGLITEKAAGIGHDSVFYDQDGRLRFEYPFIVYNNAMYPSLALEAARISMGVSNGDIKLEPGKAIMLGDKEIPIMPESSMPVHFPTADPQKYSSENIIAGNPAPETFKDKIVFIVRSGKKEINTPKGEKPDYFFSISSMMTMLSDYFISRPQWAYKAELGMLLAAGLFIMFVSSFPGWLFHSLFIIFLVFFVGGPIYLFYEQHIWLKPVVPVLCLVSGYLFGITKRFVLMYELKQHKVRYSPNPPPPPAMKKAANAASAKDNAAAVKKSLSPAVPVNEMQNYPAERTK